MPTTTERPFAYERRLREFDRIVLVAQREIARTVESAIRTGDIQTAMRRRLHLARVIAILDQLGAEVDPLARSLITDAWQQSADRTLSRIGALSLAGREVAGAFGMVSREAVQALHDSIAGSLRASRDTIGRQTQDVYAKAGRQAALRAVLGVDGSTRTARRRLMADLLKDRDLERLVMRDGTGFVDRAGKRWALDTYAQMVVRTVTREAVVQGAVARMVSHGVTLARWLVSGSACSQCQQYANRLVDLTGTGGDFEGETAMTGPTPPLHPQCTCALTPVAARVERLRREPA